MAAIEANDFRSGLLILLDEIFAEVHGWVLDGGTSLFETLAGISAAEASIPVGGKCATLAAQVAHVAFYLEVVERSIREPGQPPADWGHIWQTVSAVDEQEWAAIQAELHTQYDRILALLNETETWKDADELAGAMAIVVHTAYHLGEIRQALCTLKH